MAKDDRKLVTRARIVDVAVQQFALRGFEGATVKTIAELAGVASATVHWHFDTKSSLYAEAMREAGRRFMAVMRHDGRVLGTFANAALSWVTRFRNSEASLLLRGSGIARHRAVDDAAQWVNDQFVDFWVSWLVERDLNVRVKCWRLGR